MYYIYRHILPDGKSYIGKTKNIKSRFQKGKGYQECTKFRDAIEKYGWDNIKHEILFETEDETEARKLEKIMIKKFNSIENGYNSVNTTILRKYNARGKTKVFKQYDKDGNFINEYVGTKELLKNGYVSDRIMAHIKGRTKTTYNSIWKVVEIDKEDKNIECK